MNTAGTDTTSIAVEHRHDGASLRIGLQCGKGNILTGAVMRELRAVIAEAEANRDLKAIVLTADGKHFSFGASVEEHRSENADAMLEEFHRLILDVAELGVPLISCVSGSCLGGAMELALAGNFIFADATAQFGQPEIVLGVFAPPASLLLPMRIGWARAEELLITGATISAARAHEIGIATRLFDDRQSLLEGTDAWIAEHLIAKSASSIRFAVRAERMRMVEMLRQMLPRLKELYIDELMVTYDANEGIDAFLSRRSPSWQNA